MSIKNHLGALTPTIDQLNAIQQLELFLENDSKVFILQGYAGTGKTTILKVLIDYIKEQKKEFSLMAPTGRAAKILRDKTGTGYTIHKSIYNFKNLESINKELEDEASHSFHYYFPINEMDTSNSKIIIVDESSMISSIESKNELFTFGTNILLDDLLTYASLKTSSNKIIFVGDPAQLPPVGDNKSLALDANFYRDKELKVQEVILKEIKRQSNNLIVQNASLIRNFIESQKRSHLKFQFDTSSFCQLSALEVVSKYIELFPKPEIGDGVIISFTNQQCFQYNQSIRSRLFPNQFDLVPGDLLLLNNNNYHTYGIELFNGDILKVVNVESSIVKQSAPVWCDEKGHKVRKEITLSFRKITIRTVNHPEDISCYIIDSHLQSINRDLTICEMKALYINFVMRFNEQQKRRKEQGLNTYKVGSDEFKDLLKNDPFFNALKVKFGYAITCHKAQGGEWKEVFVDYYGKISLKNEPLRWCYTATTRAVETLYAVNPPSFGTYSKLKFSEIGRIGTLPNDSLYLDNISISPFHAVKQHKAKSLKYWEVLEKIENTAFKIREVESREYLERYTIEFGEILFKIEASHKSSGHFVNQFKVVTAGIDTNIIEEIELIFNSRNNTNIKPSYYPSKTFLEELYSEIQSICDELEITITNVIEAKNYVNYYLITDSICSYIQFYFNDKDDLTTAMPKTFECDDDKKLKLLIEKLLSHVI